MDFSWTDFNHWQDRIIARLQQPYSLDCIPVEAEYQVCCSNIVHLLKDDFHFYVAEQIRIIRFLIDFCFFNWLSISIFVVHLKLTWVLFPCNIDSLSSMYSYYVYISWNLWELYLLFFLRLIVHICLCSSSSNLLPYPKIRLPLGKIRCLFIWFLWSKRLTEVYSLIFFPTRF